jgi:uncharacterized protein YlxW (UPF0749 family)
VLKKEWIFIPILSTLFIFSACSQQSANKNTEYQYSGQNQKLLNQINDNMKKQSSLAKSTNQLSREISALNQEINKQKEKNITKKEKLLLYSKIEEKEESIYMLEKINDSVLYDSKSYDKVLNNSDISIENKKTIKNSINDILENLHSIKKALTYNLKQLQLFKTKLSS